MAVDEPGQSADHESLRLRPARGHREVRGPHRVGLDGGNESIPHEQREVVVVGVGGPRHQGCGKGRPLGDRQPLQRRGEREPHQAAGIALRQPEKLGRHRLPGGRHTAGIGGGRRQRPEHTVEQPVIGEEPYARGADVLVRVGEQAAEHPGVGTADGVQRERRAAGHERVGRGGMPSQCGVEGGEICRGGRAVWQAATGPGGEQEPGLSDVPFIAMHDDASEVGRGCGGEIRRGDGLGRATGDAEDPAARAVRAGVLVALAGVAPVEGIHRAVGAGRQVDPAKERVGRLEDVGPVAGDVAAAGPLQPLAVEPAAVEVPREQVAPILGGPGPSQIDHRAGVGVAAAEVVGGAVPRALPAAGDIEVPVVGVHVEQLVGVRIGIDRVRPDVVRAGNDLPQMAVDGVREEAVAPGVPVVTPGIGRAVAQGLEPAGPRREPPDAARHRHAIGRRRAGPPHRGRAGGAAAAVEPAVGAEPQPVGEVVVVLRRRVEAVEHDLRRAVGHGVAVGVGHEEQLRRAEEPDATEPDLDARQLREIVAEHRPPVGPAVAVAVREYDHAVAEPLLELDRPPVVGEVLRDPQPAAGVPGHGDRIGDLGLGCEEADLEAVDGGEAGCGGGRRHGLCGGVLLAVERLGKLPRRGREGGQTDECKERRASHRGAAKPRFLIKASVEGSRPRKAR